MTIMTKGNRGTAEAVPFQIYSPLISCLLQRAGELVQKIIHVLRCSQWAHDPDAKNLACELAKAPGYLDAVFVEKRGANLRVVNSSGYANGVQVPDAVSFGNQHLKSYRLDRLHELPVRFVMALATLCQALFLNQGEAFV